MKPKNFPARKAARQLAALGRPDKARDRDKNSKRRFGRTEAERRAALIKPNARRIRTKKNSAARAKLARNPQ